MKTTHTIFSLAVGMWLLAGAQSVQALTLGTNITIFDGDYKPSSSWHGTNEDQETEPGMAGGQQWDLEGFFQDGTTLTMVGGFDFLNGVSGYPDFSSGDLFISTDSLYGKSTAPLSAYDPYAHINGNTSVHSNFEYEYAFDLDFTSSTYSLVDLRSNDPVTVTSYYWQNEIPEPSSSNPWKYESGGTELSSGNSFLYSGGLSSGQVGGLIGKTHYALSFDLAPFLSLASLMPGQELYFHFTMGCGNDNLIGRGITTTPTPEPATMILLGAGLAGLAGMGKKRRGKS